ncbi:PREDICTED: uncharacterized protein LOC104776261 [Camelina sativa]|uniref:Uncharacterized protein LOC104776261 n=1 Tax=Camelina sativa TaxID=90675 RepID=A0ABM1RJE1_CAMSA|nr:PREDICTED: uncharacterized protein LOC104776261 [Camelina sativa]
MTPRLDWPSFDNGWLKDFHMGAAMTMFRNRFIRDPSQYPNPRIAFLDQDMLSSLLKDYNQFALSRRNFLFRAMYLEHFNGTAPVDSQTNKKWHIHVDHLYACFFVNQNHWVALDIDLPAKTIYVYVSIPSLVKDSDLVKECIALRRMIPAL